VGPGIGLPGFGVHVRLAAGLDLSAEMLQRARTAAPFARVVRGRAENLPWEAGRFDRVFCINAMHHFPDPDAFMSDARRVLRPGGALLIVGLDPHAGLDQWWIYDYFPAALTADRTRYVATAAIRRRLEALGFVEPVTEVAQHIRSAMPFAAAIERGLVGRQSTSQLMVITDGEYEEGLHRLKAEQPLVRTDLRLYATVGRVRAAS
jgi:SAM-dependent methyltransferase